MAKAQKPTTNVSGSDRENRSGFAEVKKLMRESFKYTIISNTEAVYLLETLDNVIYSTLATVDKVSPVIRLRYQKLVSHYAFHPVDGRSSYSSTDTDAILLSSLYWCHDNAKWLNVIRSRVKLFRLYWMDLLHELDNIGSEYLDLVSNNNTTASDPEYIATRKRSIEVALCVDSGTAYGVVREIQQAVKRIERIVRKLTYPYLRKVVTHAQHFSTGNTNTFMENYQNGSVGIRIAIGRHDIALGAFASTVDRWVSNRIMTFIRENGMLVRVPDRAFTHKNIVDRYTSRNPQITLEEIAEAEGIKAKLLIESMSMVQSQTGYVDLGDEDESTSKHSHDYIDRSTDPDSPGNAVNTTVKEYSVLMRPRERVLLSIAYGVEDAYMVDALDPLTKHIERSRQLLAAKHFTSK